MLLICDGFLGTVLYLGFFAYGCWRYRRDTTPYGVAGVLVLLLSFVFMFSYNATGAPLGFTMLAYALLWRNARARRQQATLATGMPAHLPTLGGPAPSRRLTGGPGS
jgi:hypothetical protein